MLSNITDKISGDIPGCHDLICPDIWWPFDIKTNLELELEKRLLDKIAHNMYKKNLTKTKHYKLCTNCQEILILVAKQTALIRTTRTKTGQYIITMLSTHYSMQCYQISHSLSFWFNFITSYRIHKTFIYNTGHNSWFTKYSTQGLNTYTWFNEGQH